MIAFQWLFVTFKKFVLEELVKIRVIIPIVGTQFNRALQKEVDAVRAPDCEITYVNLTTGVRSVQSRYAEALNTPDIVRLAR